MKTGIMLLALGSIIYFLLKLRKILLAFIAGVLLAYLLYPILDFLKKKNVPGTWAVYILAMIFLIFSIIFSVLLVPAFLSELAGLSTTLPEYIQTINDFIGRINREYRRVEMPSTIKEALDRSLKKAEEHLIDFLEGFTDKLISGISSFFSLLLAPVITYYILKDLDKLKKGLIKWIPVRKRRLFYNIGSEINEVILGYFRGQIWLSFIVAILSTIALLFLKIPFSILLGLFVGFSNMIPYIGPILGSIPAIILALLRSPTRALSVGVLFFLVQQVENSLISPRIISKEVGIHPLMVIFALLVGAEIMGFWGLLLAVPIAGSLRVIARIIYREFYEENNEGGVN